MGLGQTVGINPGQTGRGGEMKTIFECSILEDEKVFAFGIGFSKSRVAVMIGIFYIALDWEETI